MREKSLRRDHVRWQGWNRGVKLWDVFYIHMLVWAYYRNDEESHSSRRLMLLVQEGRVHDKPLEEGTCSNCSGLYDLESNKSRV